MGVFSQSNAPETKIKRNSFDLSFHNNLTLGFGKLYPIMCKEVISGDTFKINSALGLRFMPTAFPLQTKIRAHVDYFYVRNRNLWKGFQNYLFGTGQPDKFPILSDRSASQSVRTGELGDYLGLPTTLVGSNLYVSRPNTLSSLNSVFHVEVAPNFSGSNSNKFSNAIFFVQSLQQSLTGIIEECVDFETTIPFVVRGRLGGTFEYCPLKMNITDEVAEFILAHPAAFTNEQLSCDEQDGFNNSFAIRLSSIHSSGSNSLRVYFPITSSEGILSLSIFNLLKDSEGAWRLCINKEYVTSNNLEKSQFTLCWCSYNSIDETHPNSYSFSQLPAGALTKFPNLVVSLDGDAVAEYGDYYQYQFDINALPFRAYESIYNAFYRDNRNNPYLVNGIEDPNVFLPTTDGGIDDNDYVLRRRNWEQDFLTTAMTSPQYGKAPLVGISSSGEASFRDENGDIIKSQLKTAEDGDTIVTFETTNNSSVNRSLVELASSGFSINTLRGVNALQRFLEVNFRKGLRYKDQVSAHFGVDISYNTLDMPEYLGGYTQMVDVTQVNQTSQSTDSDPLGSYAGQLSAVGGQGRPIQRFFDENGFVIAILSVVPVPCYSQLVPKFFLKTKEPLDYYMPEFAHLGNQPIRYGEVCPLQAVTEGVNINDVFGYQRAWYDYLASVDEIHGDFRKTMSSFILSRVFKTVPSINANFLTVDESNLNDVFTVNDVDNVPIDHILGQVHFDITASRPIPRYNIPSLE